METPELEITDYKPEYAEAFYKLNLAWISAAFKVEDTDLEVLQDPQKYLLDDGGAILIALYKGEPVGTCALKRMSDDLVEMCKMTVSEKMRGRKLGRLLGEAIIRKARAIGAGTIHLYSNRAGSAKAIELYKKLGFHEIPLGAKAYERADIKMQMIL
jgi:N-acetylglutamate synthase-like GNAT family acetyltransferase